MQTVYKKNKPQVLTMFPLLMRETLFDYVEYYYYLCLMYIHSYQEFGTYDESVHYINSFKMLFPHNIYETDIIGPYIIDGGKYRVNIKRLSYVNSY